jgi:hypothetical protein
LRLDDGQFELRPRQPRTSPVRSASAVAVDRRCAAATRSRARSKSATVYCRDSGRVRFLRGPFAALRHRATPKSQRIPPIEHIQRGFVSRVALIWGCMELSRPPLVVTFELSEKRKAIVADALAGASAVVYLTELDEAARAEALRNAGALLTFNTSKELRSGEAELLDGARLIQFIIAGVDFIPLSELPEGVPVATNGGGYAESMD